LNKVLAEPSTFYIFSVVCPSPKANHRWIRLKEGNAKSLLLKSSLKKDFASAVYFSEAHSSPKFLSKGGQAILYNQALLVKNRV
jgi:hypothetical protein